ncbi:AraC family transcriptional regulator [Pedobacter frigiditerrae]|uniref:AraC family transcriptional regulator n=1 Tax=Pedobacter frigiditerrae TaxID=2530452 RepID=A0A4R0MPK0_9SPHI|nr:AraC family transcriptional regulator [Pedobacter frigiditerrae]TCC88162.1 AraC family transcriptional regulator [Pedobacter frigiditerrae]
MENHFHTIEPCEKLKEYVACYYFIKSDDQDFTSKHYSFPHTYNALSIYKDSSFDSKPSNFSVRQSLNPNYQIFVQVKKQAPLMVNISGKVNRVTILFKDFGINHFINEPLSKIMGYEKDQFNSWKDDPHFPEFMVSLFSIDDEQEKGRIIDKFLLQRFAPIPLSYLESAVALLCNFEKNLSIEKIAAQFNVSLRSFNRNFKDVLGVSPVEYRRIAQFRYSIENKFFQTQFKRLTDIGYESHFYDQSYFNKIYHKLTGSNPKTFFKSIERIGDDKLIFQFIKK